MARVCLTCILALSLITAGIVGCDRQEQRTRRLAAQLGDVDAAARAEAIKELQQIGRPAVPTLLDILQHDSPAVRASALWVLGEIAEPVELAVPSIIPVLGDEDENVRTAASMALTEMGTSAVPFLIRALDEPSADIRLHAAYALGEIGEPVDLLIPALIQRLGDPVWNVRRVSVRALLDIGSQAVPQLNEALNSEDAGIRRFAAIALDQMKHRKR